MITNTEFRIFINFYTKVNICAGPPINRLHFDCCMICDDDDDDDDDDDEWFLWYVFVVSV